MKQSKIISIFVFFIFLINTAVWAQPQFNKEEVNNTPAVKFINRSNKRMNPARRDQEVNNGREMAKEIITNKEVNKYGFTIQRVFDAKSEALGADIISINKGSDFGHINRVHRTLSGYLQEVFNYKEDQSEILAKFILYYNATNRKNMDKIKTSYSADVAKAVSPDKIGIDKYWKNWSGQTQIIIPLTRNLARPDETDIKKDEIKDDKKATDDEKTKIDEVIKDSRDEDKKVIDNKIDEIDKKKEELNKKIQDLQKDPEKNKEEITKKEEEKKQVEEEKKELEKEKEKIVEEEKKAEETKTDTGDSTDSTDSNDTGDKTDATDTTTDDKKEETATTDDNKTDSNATDENKTDNKKEPLDKKEEVSENVVENKILFMRVLKYQDGGHYNNQLWWIDINKDDALSKSPYNNICSKGFLVVPDTGVLVIGYTGADHDPKSHQLVFLDAKNLEKKSQSSETIHWRSPMEFRDGKIYAIMIESGNHYIARFNTDLTLDARGTEAINPNSDITYTPKKIYITGSPMEGQPTTIRIFNKDDLKLLKTIDSDKLK